MSKHHLSAKDLAFEKERYQFRHRIREKDQAYKQLQQELSDVRSQISELESKIAEQNDWIERLLAYMDLTPEEFQKLKDHISVEDEIYSHIMSAFRPFFR